MIEMGGVALRLAGGETRRPREVPKLSLAWDACLLYRSVKNVEYA
jgi:hypothetical protein